MRACLPHFSGLVLAAYALMGADQLPVQSALPPQRIVSTSLCGDSYVLALAQENQITALSWQSKDSVATTLTSLGTRPQAWDDVERLLALRPDLVVFGAGEGARAKPFLDKAGISYVSISWGEDFGAVHSNIDTLARALHIQTPIQAIPKTSAHPKKPTILYLSSAGGTAGPGTFIDAVIKAAGGTNIITQTGWFTPDLESLSQLRPDLIITSFVDDGYASINAPTLRHTMLRAKIKAVPHINVPGKYWPCAGPGLYRATGLVANAVRKLP
jgi:iron complex transport system substrate-binding protein